MPGAVEFGISVPMSASDATKPGEPWALKVSPVGKQGMGACRNRIGWLVCGHVCVGVAGKLIAAERLRLLPLSHSASVGGGQLSLWSGSVPQ